MGAINYYTSNYVTVGYDLSIEYDEENEEYRDIEIEYAWDDVKALLNNYSFWYYNVKIEPGYYEGFSINIECNFGVAWDDCYQKREAQKEITQIKKFLLECLDYNMCVVHPGWCTGYLNFTDSVKEINEAIKAIRDEARNTPTWTQYERGGK